MASPEVQILDDRPGQGPILKAGLCHGVFGGLVSRRRVTVSRSGGSQGWTHGQWLLQARGLSTKAVSRALSTGVDSAVLALVALSWTRSHRGSR